MPRAADHRLGGNRRMRPIDLCAAKQIGPHENFIGRRSLPKHIAASFHEDAIGSFNEQIFHDDHARTITVKIQPGKDFQFPSLDVYRDEVDRGPIGPSFPEQRVGAAHPDRNRLAVRRNLHIRKLAPDTQRRPAFERDLSFSVSRAFAVYDGEFRRLRFAISKRQLGDIVPRSPLQIGKDRIGLYCQDIPASLTKWQTERKPIRARGANFQHAAIRFFCEKSVSNHFVKFAFSTHTFT